MDRSEYWYKQLEEGEDPTIVAEMLRHEMEIERIKMQARMDHQNKKTEIAGWIALLAILLLANIIFWIGVLNV